MEPIAENDEQLQLAAHHPQAVPVGGPMVVPVRRGGEAAIVSGSEDTTTNSNHDNPYSSSDEEAEDASMRAAVPDVLYGANMDDEDEAWVYQNMRGGVAEPVPIRTRHTNTGTNTDTMDTTTTTGANKSDADDSTSKPCWVTKQVMALKPRSSDAVLSCPCCFELVCMDCQEHERYQNQYRAMFVMNIGVHWDRRLVYDEASQELTPFSSPQSPSTTPSTTSPDMNPIPNHDDTGTAANNSKHNAAATGPEIYYSVYCNNCQTEVAALDMTDEVYYFYGCLASSS
jgi:hypothetical protein